MKTLLVFLMALVAMTLAMPHFDLVPTPFGLRPKQCVHRNLGENVTLRPTQGGVHVVHENGTVLRLLPAIPECIAWEERMSAQREMRRNGSKVPAPLDGWLDNAGYYPPGLVGRFTGNYHVPRSPVDANQVLFYFIGTENFQKNVGVSILQPVLTWGNGINGWSMASWNCCPSGQAHESTPLTGFGSGDTLVGQIVKSGSNWEVVSSFGGRRTVLTVPDAGRTFDWTDVTLETYRVSACNQFPPGPMTFSQMVMHLESGAEITPNWSPTGATECNGRMTVSNPATITISHS